MTAQPAPEGFAYRILYIDPYLVQDALGGRSPPFVRNPIVDLAARQSNALSAVWEMEREIDDVGRTDVVAAVADIAACCACAVSSPRAQPIAIRSESWNVWPISTAGRWCASFAPRSAPAPVAFVPCDSSIGCAGC